MINLCHIYIILFISFCFFIFFFFFFSSFYFLFYILSFSFCLFIFVTHCPKHTGTPLLIYNALYVLYLLLSLYLYCLFPILPHYQQTVKVSNNQMLYILSLYKSQLLGILPNQRVIEKEEDEHIK